MLNEHPFARRSLAGLLAIGAGFLDIFGSHFISKAKKRYTSHLIAHFDLTNRKLVLERFKLNKYDNNQIRERDYVEALTLPVSDNWEEGKYYIEAHNASHFHHDLSIIINGRVYRMARTPSINNTKKGFLGLLPGPGEKSSWTLQPEHMASEVPNPSIIDDGYGAGTSKVIAKGQCLVRLSDSNNLEVIFDQFDGVYAFIEKDKSCLIVRKFKEGHKLGKLKMSNGDNSKLEDHFTKDNELFIAKYNGAMAEWRVEKTSAGTKALRIYSWRPDAKLKTKFDVDNQIDHTYRLLIAQKKLPDDFPMCEGRAELWIDKKDGLLRLNSVLNSGYYNSINNPNNKLVQFVVYDITRFEGKKIGDISYSDKLQLIEDLSAADPRFQKPQVANSIKDKKLLWNSLKHNNCFDGVIIWDLNEPDKRPIKMKFKHEADTWHQGVISRVEPQEGQHSDKYAYPIILLEDGTEFKCSGIGLSNDVKAELYSDPRKYIGKTVYYSAEHHFDSGKPFQPILKEILQDN